MRVQSKTVILASLLTLILFVPATTKVAATNQTTELTMCSAARFAGQHSNAPSIHNPNAATHRAVASGNWSDPATWASGNIPSDNATVAIPVGIIVTVDTQLTPKLKSIAIDGTLRFATEVNTELWVDTITSSVSGTLEVGTPANPIAADVTARVVFADLGPIDQTVDPGQLGRGAILAGKTVMFGAAKTHRATVAVFPRVDDTTLQLSSAPSGWRIGDEIIITGSQGSTSEEVRNATAINGTTITLNQPLALDHVPPKADLNLWVANTTRNIQFESENKDDILRRGHLMFMHTLDVNINHAGFYELGRTDKRIPLDDWEYEIDEEHVGNQGPSPIVFTPIAGPSTNIRGRYALHVHRGSNDPSSTPAVYRGSVVVDTPGWAFVNHSSHVNMIDNVSYLAQGSGFYTEAGDEVGSMVGNIAIRTVNDTFTLDDEGAIDPDLGLDRGDFGRDGDGFWLSGNRVSVIDNVSAGASAHGIIFWVDGLIEHDIGRVTIPVSQLPNGHLIPNRDTVPVWWAPLAEVRNNESYGATVGFRSRYIHSQGYMGEAARYGSSWHEAPPQAYIDTLTPIFDGITVWDSRDGVLLNYNERISTRNLRLIGTGAPFQHNLGRTAAVGVGLDLNNEETLGPGFVENAIIEGYEMGFIAPRQGTWRLNNLTLSSVTDILIHEPRQIPRTMPMTNITFGSLEGTAVAGQESNRRHIVMDPGFDDASHDPNYLVFNDTITLDGREIYYNEQRADFVPYPVEGEIEEVTAGYIGKTNQQLFDEFGLAFGGEVLPASSVVDARIVNGRLAAGANVNIYLPMIANQ